MPLPVTILHPSSFVIAAFVGSLLAATVLHAETADRPNGLQLYMARHDRAAIVALEAQRQSGVESRLSRLALADLYFSTRRLSQARHELERLAEDDPFDDIALWLGWIDFAAGHDSEAEHMLTSAIATGESHELVAKAVLTLGWQLLLRGRAAAAADIFAIGANADTLPAIDEQMRFLRGQALMFAGKYLEAERVLATVRSETLSADAARDIAWCRYAQGDIASAREALEAVADVEDRGRSPIRLAWPAVLTRGPRSLAQRWETLYRKRARGQDPTAFLLTLADRDAAADARAMLREFFADDMRVREPAAPDLSRSRTTDQQGARPPLVSDHPGGQIPPTATRVAALSTGRGFLLLIVACALLLRACARLARKRGAR